MKKYFGWMVALMASLTMVAAYADDDACEVDTADEVVAIVADDEVVADEVIAVEDAVAEDDAAEEQIAVIIDDDLDDQLED